MSVCLVCLGCTSSHGPDGKPCIDAIRSDAEGKTGGTSLTVTRRSDRGSGPAPMRRCRTVAILSLAAGRWASLCPGAHPAGATSTGDGLTAVRLSAGFYASSASLLILGGSRRFSRGCTSTARPGLASPAKASAPSRVLSDRLDIADMSDLSGLSGSRHGRWTHVRQRAAVPGTGASLPATVAARSGPCAVPDRRYPLTAGVASCARGRHPSRRDIETCGDRFDRRPVVGRVITRVRHSLLISRR